MLLQTTFLRAVDPEDVDEGLEGIPMTDARKAEAAEFLLNTDTGDWRDDSIVHHCQYGCCRSVQESKVKLWIAIQAQLVE